MMKTKQQFEEFIVSDNYVEIRGRAANSDELAEGVWQHQQALIDALHIENKLLNEAITEDKILIAYAKELENKLAIAVEALEKLARLGNEPHYGNSVGNDIARKALGNDHCQCPECINGLSHDSDCAVHNMPAYPNKTCDCTILQPNVNAVIEKCAKVATNACLAPPDGGTPMSYEVELCDAIAEAIRDLKIEVRE